MTEDKFFKIISAVYFLCCFSFMSFIWIISHEMMQQCEAAGGVYIRATCFSPTAVMK